MSQGASKVALSSITSKELWERSGRFEQLGSEVRWPDTGIQTPIGYNGKLRTWIQLFKFEDRKQVPYMLTPTHEEEITALVSRISQSYKDLPLRLYQICMSYVRVTCSHTTDHPLKHGSIAMSSDPVMACSGRVSSS